MRTQEIMKCYRCGKEQILNGKQYQRDILFLHHFNEGRKPTCNECTIELSKEGKIPCVHRYNHHIVSTCQTCGMED